uniref:Nuclear antigen homolog n=1 Tax=Arabidopsis thaliana TaxID=3702 RepID=Q8LFI3_ARATH|nr:nuclear antigen homolog [Arabidopsis thaliana]
MATLNPFDLLDDDAEDPSQLAVSIEKIDKSKKSGPVSSLPAKSAPKLPSKPLPPAQAVREARSDAPRGRGRGGFSRGHGGYNRDDGNNGYSGGYTKPSGEGDVSKSSYERRGGGGAPRGSFRGEGGGPGGGRRGGFSNEGGEGERPRRTYERRSGTGRGSDFKRDGSGRGNWGTPGEEIAAETEAVAGVETQKDVGEKPAVDDVAADANKENTVVEEKEPEDKEMTLDEYEKILEEKKKALQSLTTSERKVDTKVFESMQQLSNKKSNDEIFIKLGSDKDKRKDDKEEKAKKAVSINEFLKPAGGGDYYRGGRGGRGRGGRGRGGVSSGESGGYRNEAAPAIGDAAQFPSLGGK